MALQWRSQGDARLAVMQMVDSLNVGGMERVAVNIANSMPADRFCLHLCTTRLEGPLARLVEPHIGRLRLYRKCFIGINAIHMLRKYVTDNHINIVHAHGTSVFLACLSLYKLRRIKVIWHVHAGWLSNIPARWPYRLLKYRLNGVITVNTNLKNWVVKHGISSPEKTWYLSNFIDNEDNLEANVSIPGHNGNRIVCVGNLRKEKDHINLLNAMKRVVQHVPSAHLVVVGAGKGDEYERQFISLSRSDCLRNHVTWLGARGDVRQILSMCDIGVISSMTEGLPLALIEYGMSGLAVVSTKVGECSRILDEGKVGNLVEPGDSESLARATVQLLKSPSLRKYYGEGIRAHFIKHYGREKSVSDLCSIYDQILL